MGKIKSSSPNFSGPGKLTNDHNTDKFDCGISVLNNWLRRYALQNQQANAATTFVVCSSRNHVVGYYSLAVGSIEHEAVLSRIRKGMARHPIPIMILARLAVDLRYQGQNIGKGLLKDAILRTLQVSDHAGIRALFVHAKDDKAHRFYERFGFESGPIDPLKLMLLIKDARKTVLDL